VNKSILVLAKNWEYIKLGDIVQKISNGITKRQLKSGSGISVTRIETISNGMVDLNKVGYLKDLTKESIEKYKLMKDDILFSHINSDFHLGKTAIFNLENIVLLHGMNLLLIRVNPKIMRAHFLNYLFNYYRFTGYFISIAQHAVNQSSINQKKLKNILIPLPPRNEQNRIVEKIEELFSGLDKATEELQKVQVQLKVYRQSVLKAAFEGKYVKRFVYTEVPLSKFERKGGGTPSTKKREYWNGDINWITSANINSQNKIHFDKKITQSGVVNSSTNVIPKNSVIIVTRVGLGKVSVNEVNTAINQDCQGIICNNINPYYLMWYLKNIANDFIFKGQGTTINGITISKLNEIIIKVPEMTIQNQIVQEIESRLSVCDKIEESVESVLKKIEHLRQSILKKAFEGKLVSQDPEDLPASELLKEIKIEKEKTKNNSKKKVKA
jgi:type I restriction enzyme, S subunit